MGKINKYILYHVVYTLLLNLSVYTQGVISVSPLQNALNITVNTSMSASFNVPVARASVNDTTIRVWGSISGLHQCTFSFEHNDSTVLINPISLFRNGEKVRITLTDDILSISQIPFPKFAWEFTIKTKSNFTSSFDVTFYKDTTYLLSNAPHSICAGDFDKDGNVDLLVAQKNNNSLSHFTNDGNGKFTVIENSIILPRPEFVTSADIDNDYDLDIIVLQPRADSLSIYKNDGFANFTLFYVFVEENHSMYYEHITVDDFNNDGFRDIVMFRSPTHEIVKITNHNGDYFSSSISPSIGNGIHFGATGDIDNDGDIDIVVSNTQSIFATRLLNDGNLNFIADSINFLPQYPRQQTSAQLADFDNDNNIDAVVSTINPYGTVIFKNNGIGNFVWLNSNLYKVKYPREINTFDYNGDNTIDLLVANQDNNYVTYGPNTDGLGGCGYGIQLWGYGDSIRYVTSSDFDNDGDIDFVTSNYGSNSITLVKNRISLISVMSEINIGDVFIQSSRDTSVILYNYTSQSITVSDVEITEDSSFSVLGEHSFTIPPQSYYNVSIRFSPKKLSQCISYLCITASTLNEKVKLIGNGINPIESKLLIEFDSTIIGLNNEKLLKLSNISLNPISISSSLIGDYFSMLSSGNFIIPPLDSHFLLIRFNPVQPTLDSAYIYFYHKEQFLVSASKLMGKGRINLNNLNIYPSSIEFNSPIGITDTKILTFNNLGNTTIQIDSITNSNDNFSIQHNPFILNSEQTLYISVKFKGEVIASFTDTLKIYYDSNLMYRQVFLYGVSSFGNRPEINYTPLSYQFDSISWGDADTITGFIYNHGNAVLDVSGNAYLPGNFELLFAQNFTLQPGDSQRTRIRFTPRGILTLTDTVKLYNNDISENPIKILLKGKAINNSDIFIHPKRLMYDSTRIDSFSLETFWIYNNGGSNLIINNYSHTNNAYSVLNLTTPLLLEPDDSTTIIVKFAPPSIGLFSDTLKLFSNDIDEKNSYVYLSGVGINVTGVKENYPLQFMLYQNYPNPFNPTTSIKYSLPRVAFVKLQLFNIYGQLVQTLVNEQKMPGTHEIKFNASQYSSGVYFYRLQAENFVTTKKLLLIK